MRKGMKEKEQGKEMEDEEEQEQEQEENNRRFAAKITISMMLLATFVLASRNSNLLSGLAPARLRTCCWPSGCNPSCPWFW